MAAPNGTKWGSTANSKGRIGIYAKVSSSATTTTVEISVYFWSKYAVNDSSNKYYYNSNATSATTLIGSRSIKTTTNGGDGWSTTNQVRIAGPSTYSYKRGTTNVTKSFAAKLTGVDWVGGTMTVTTSITVPKLASYTISFNANGGSGAPGSQTKWYGKALTIPSTRPSRTGHSFRGWGLSSTTSTVSYSPGGSYTTNASDTLYAVWAPDTYQVQYNANGGSGAPGSQTKVYGQTLTLSSTRPTRANYNFLGWSTSKTAISPTYSPGSSYTGNNHITLYAVWQLAYAKPRISGFKASRCNSDGTDNELGTYVKVSFNWSSDRTVTKIGGQYKRQGASQWSEMATTIPASGTSGSVADKIIDSGYSSDVTYFVRVYVSDSGGTGYSSEASISTPSYPIDIKAKGTGVAIGKVAEKDCFEVNMQSYFYNSIILPNGVNLYSKAANGTNLVMTWSNSANQFGFGYGSRSQSIGSVYFDGNNIYIRSNNVIQLDKELTTSSFGVTSSFGSKNGSWCHIYTNAAKGFAVNDSINMVGSGYLGTTSHPAGSVFIKNSSGAIRSVDASGSGWVNMCWTSSSNNVYVGGGDSPPNRVYLKAKNMANVFAVTHDGSDRVYSMSIYDRTYSGGPNVVLTSKGTLGRNASSSRRYKKDIVSIADNLEKQKYNMQLFTSDKLDTGQIIDPRGLYDIPVMQYKYIDGYLSHDDVNIDKDVIGIIAEDVAKFYPQAAIYDEDGAPEAWNSDPILVGLLYLVQEQKKELDALKKQIGGDTV